MLTFVTWLWEGWRNVYKPDHVYRMRDMLAQHYKKPHRFICVTDNPSRFKNIETVLLWKENSFSSRPRYLPNCYRRLFLFSEAAKEIFGESAVSIDLDAIILKDITGLFGEDDFKILKGFCNPYNGSLWQVKPGVYSHVWDRLDERLIKAAIKRTGFYGSDQSVMAYCLKRAQTWGPEDGLYQYLHIGRCLEDNSRILFFAGKVKPWESRFSKLYWSN